MSPRPDSTATARAWAVYYLARGWAPIPVPFRSKKPTLDAWQTLRLMPETLDQYFNGKPQNVGVLLGEPSAGLLDVDLDVPEAIALAPRFLPATACRFGRPGKRESHWLYVASPLVPTAKFPDIEKHDADPTAMVVELRSTGGQTVFPGSVHKDTGEAIEFSADGEPAMLDGAELRRGVVHLAVAAMLLRHWPTKGQRHETVLAAAGFLVGGGVAVADATTILTAVARQADPGADLSIVKHDVASTAAKIAAGEPATGGPSLAELLRGDGVKVVALLRRWLGLRGADGEHLTDVGNAARFITACGDDFRYCYAWKSWLAWGGTRWRRDAGDLAALAAKATARARWGEIAQARGEDHRKQLAKWAAYSESEPGIRRMLILAQPDLAIRPDQLDADPWLLNCPNGTLELRTGHLRPHRREDLITKITAAPYAPDARSDVWDSFLEAALPDALDYAQRYAGYCLTGSTREEVFVFCRGPAGGGKSTFAEGLRRTWGDYATSADFTVFLTKKPSDGPREDIARLAGARLVTSVETRDGQRLAEGLVKLLTGGDTVAARRLYERTFEFVPQFKLLLASNYRPQARADDDGLWRRLRELPFPTARLKREERDDRVKTAIVDPAQTGPAILAWAVEGCARWLADGLGEPDAVMTATASYRASMEPLADFIADSCEVGEDCSVTAERLRAEYETWCRTEGIKAPVGGKTWGAALRAAGCTDRRTASGRWWDGIALRGAGSREPGEDPPW